MKRKRDKNIDKKKCNVTSFVKSLNFFKIL